MMSDIFRYIGKFCIIFVAKSNLPLALFSVISKNDYICAEKCPRTIINH